MNKIRWKNKRLRYTYLLGCMLLSPHMIQASPVTPLEQVQLKNQFINPLKIEIEVLSPFGEVREGYIHKGVDIRTPIGTPIYAAEDGIVIKAAPDSKGVESGGGNMIILDHGNEEQTWYMHLHDYAVVTGQKVTKGQLIGFAGCTGDSTTPLLHFEYHKGNIAVDPTFIFEIPQFLITLNEPFYVLQT